MLEKDRKSENNENNEQSGKIGKVGMREAEAVALAVSTADARLSTVRAVQAVHTGLLRCVGIVKGALG